MEPKQHSRGSMTQRFPNPVIYPTYESLHEQLARPNAGSLPIPRWTPSHGAAAVQSRTAKTTPRAREKNTQWNMHLNPNENLLLLRAERVYLRRWTDAFINDD